MYKYLLACISYFVLISLAHAVDSEDTRLRLEQQTVQQQQQRDAASLAAADALNQAPINAIDDANLAAALYHTVQQRHWQRARELLARYEILPDADALLIGYTKGALARANGDYDAAIRHLQKVSENAPKEFLLPKLALGRAQFEDHQDNAAQQTFNQVSNLLDRQAEYQQGVIKTVDTFLTALEHRQGWQGSLSVGIAHDNNINQSSDASTCLHYIGSICAIKRSVPKSITARGINYEGVLQRRFSVSGNHGVLLRGIAFGDIYQNQGDYNNHQLILSAGYSFQDVNDDWAISPVFKYTAQGHHTDHKAWGIDTTWRHTLSAKCTFSLGAGIEHQQYPKAANLYDGNLINLNAGLWQGIGDSWIVFGQLRFAQKDSKTDVFSYQEGSLRVGATKYFGNDFNLTLQGRWLQRQYQENNAIFGVKRRDSEQYYSAALNAPKWEILGLEPGLLIEYTRNHSNVDWLYSYDKTQISLRLQKRF